MPIVVFAGRKGGCGKTTGATNLAAWLASEGHQVALLDSDPERQALTWHTLRAGRDDVAAIHAEHVTGDVRRTIISLAAEYEWVVVDTPGLDSVETKRAIAVATVTLYPFKTSIYDLKALSLADMLAEEIQAVRPAAVALAYASETDSGRSGEVDRAGARAALAGCRALKLMDAHTSGRKSYRQSANSGLGVCQWPDAKASAEFDLLAQEVMRHV
jgi:chromosome partitioning protein